MACLSVVELLSSPPISYSPSRNRIYAAWGEQPPTASTYPLRFKEATSSWSMRHQFHEEIVEYFSKRGVSAVFLFGRNILRRMVSLLANAYGKQARLLNGTHESHVHLPLEGEVPLVGNTTRGFKDEAVFDQEFINVPLHRITC